MATEVLIQVTSSEEGTGNKNKVLKKTSQHAWNQNKQLKISKKYHCYVFSKKAWNGEAKTMKHGRWDESPLPIVSATFQQLRCTYPFIVNLGLKYSGLWTCHFWRVSQIWNREYQSGTTFTDTAAWFLFDTENKDIGSKDGFLLESVSAVISTSPERGQQIAWACSYFQ